MHLVLNSFGSSLQRRDGNFVVVTAEGEQAIHPPDLKSISVARGARVSSDAVLLAIEHEIDLLFLDRTGMPLGRVWSVQYGSLSEIRRRQLDFAQSPAALPWVKELLLAKLDNLAALLLMLDPGQPPLTNQVKGALNSIADHGRKIAALKAEWLHEAAASLRGWEGAAAKRYFAVVSAALPPDYQFEGRSQHPATDWTNALLNYGYGMLYAKVEGALIRAGLDPYVGIMHRENHNRPVLAFDVIERYRVWVDYVVVQLCRQEAFSPECFETTPTGACLLQGLGKRILIQAVNDYLAEIVELNGQARSREHHLQLYAHALAQFFLKKA
jgi:CRISP-associated protein Cas1